MLAMGVRSRPHCAPGAWLWPRKQNSAPAGGHELATFSGIRIIARFQSVSISPVEVYQNYNRWEEDI